MMNKKKRKQLVALIELVLATIIAIWVVRVANKRPSYDTTSTSQPATTLPKRPHYSVPKGNTSRYKLNDPHSKGYDQGYNQGLEDGRNGERFECEYDDNNAYSGENATHYRQGYEEGYADGYAEGRRIWGA